MFSPEFNVTGSAKIILTEWPSQPNGKTDRYLTQNSFHVPSLIFNILNHFDHFKVITVVILQLIFKSGNKFKIKISKFNLI